MGKVVGLKTTSLASIPKTQWYNKIRSYSKNEIHLETLDTIGNCQRPVFSLVVSQHMHTIANLWKFEHIWSSKLRDNETKRHSCHTKLCVFRCLISRPQILNLRSRDYFLNSDTKNATVPVPDCVANSHFRNSHFI